MKILSEMPTGMGGKWVLVDYENNHYSFGFEQDLHDIFGFPTNQCGTKEYLLERLNSRKKLCIKSIKQCEKELKKERKNIDGWEQMIKYKQKELEMLTEFARILEERKKV